MSAVVRRTGEAGTAWTREEALEWYARARAKTGRRVTFEEMVPYQKAFVRLFGSVAAFQEAGGDEPGTPGRPRSTEP